MYWETWSLSLWEKKRTWFDSNPRTSIFCLLVQSISEKLLKKVNGRSRSLARFGSLQVKSLVNHTPHSIRQTTFSYYLWKIGESKSKFFKLINVYDIDYKTFKFELENETGEMNFITTERNSLNLWDYIRWFKLKTFS